MRCRLLNLLAALSLLLCAAVVVMWVRSYYVADTVMLLKVFGDIHNPERKFVDLDSAQGGIGLSWGRRADTGYPSQLNGIEAWSHYLGIGKGWQIRRQSSRAAEQMTYPFLTGYHGRFGFAVDSFRHDTRALRITPSRIGWPRAASSHTRQLHSFSVSCRLRGS